MLKKIYAILKYINKHPLAGKHRSLAYYKFFSWQIVQFLKPRERVVKFTSDSSLLVSKGMTGATGNIYLGLHEFNDMGFLLHFLRPNDLFYDVGANIGSYTVLASAHCKANTISFEPIPSTYSSLIKNIRLNNISNLVVAKNIGLGKNKTVLKFTTSLDTVNHVISGGESSVVNAVEVQVETGDTILQESRCPILMKIDVEGFETDVLKGMPNLLSNLELKAIIIELNGSGGRYGFDEFEIHTTLLNLGFKPSEYNPFERTIKMIDGFGSFNTIYIRDVLFTTERIQTADKVTVFSESF
jgi:FkbM family methyltransferase